jgi:glycine/D-amino acid oxidase-like deaminating enzyme
MVVDADLGLYWRPRTEGMFIGWEHALPWDQRPAPAMDPVPADWRYLLRVRRYGRRLMRFWEKTPFTDVVWHTGQYVAPASNDGRPIIGLHPHVGGLWINTGYEGRGSWPARAVDAYSSISSSVPPRPPRIRSASLPTPGRTPRIEWCCESAPPV